MFILLAYLAATGTVTNAAIVTRGLCGAVARASKGDLHAAGVEALSAISAPTVLAITATASMVHDVFKGAHELLTPALSRLH